MTGPMAKASEEQGELPLIRAKLYFMMLRYNTSSAITLPGENAPMDHRQINWLSNGMVQSSHLKAGRISGPYSYVGDGQLFIGTRNEITTEFPIKSEVQCNLGSDGEKLVLLFPSRNNDLSLENILNIALPANDPDEKNLYILNANSQQLAVRISGAKTSLILDPMQIITVPKTILKDMITLRIDLATQQTEGKESNWKRIPGTRVLIDEQQCKIVLVHPSFESQEKWVVRQLSLKL
jgi:hypothetical protein